MSPCVVHAHRPGLHLDHPPRVGPEKEDVALGGLDGEVLVHRTDGHAVRVEDDAVVPRLGDGAATGQSGEPRSSAGAQPAVDRVVMEMGAPPAASGADAP